MNVKHLVPVLVISIISFACKKEYTKSVNQNNIAQKISLQYSDDSTYAYISFHQHDVNGASLFLSNGASITINGQAPTQKTDPTYNTRYYEITWYGKIDSATFVYTDLNSNTYTNLIYLRTVDFPIGFNDTIESNIDIIFDWQGYPNSIVGNSSAQSEDVSVELCAGGSCQYGGSISAGDSSGIINYHTPGNYSLGMARKYFSNTIPEGTNAGGVWRSWYFTERRQVIVQ